MIIPAILLLAQVASPQAAPVNAPPSTLATVEDELLDSVGTFFSGTWKGSGTFVRNGLPVRSTYRFETVLGGAALRLHHAEDKPADYAFDGLISRDSGSRELVLLIASNGPGGARIFRSKGWDKDRLVFTADPALRARFALERLTFTREGAKQFRARYELSRDGVKWGGGDEQIFVRV